MPDETKLPHHKRRAANGQGLNHVIYVRADAALSAVLAALSRDHKLVVAEVARVLLRAAASSPDAAKVLRDPRWRRPQAPGQA